VITLYQRRLKDLANDKRFKYVIIFKNFGESAGTSVEHAHSQIIALPMIPKYVLSELQGVRGYYEKNQRCVFCDMIEQEKTEQKRIVAENEAFIAFCPFVPRQAFEYWILPKDHAVPFTDMGEETRGYLGGLLRETLKRLKVCLNDPSYNYYLHCAPVNTGRYTDIHWHIEVVPKLAKTTGFEWGTGFYVVRTSPEDAAGYLKNIQMPAAL
jgi:UDPglucose--hexose-1-phosphate uridylyltransferase